MKKTILALAMLLIGVLSATAKTEKRPAYLYGFATSFNDSTVWFVEIQLVEEAYIDSKTKFLCGRDSYSYQLRDYLRSAGCNTPTCITGFALTKKKAEEKYLKLRTKYLSKGNYNIKYISSSDFKYTAVPVDEETVYVESSKAKPKGEKKSKKKQEK